MDDGVARRAAATRNARPVSERVNLEHDAVDLVGQLPAQVAVFVVMRDDFVRVNFQNLLDTIANPPQLLRRQTESIERFEHFRVFPEFNAFHCAGRVKHGANGAPRDEARIELLECAGSGVAGVGKRFFTGGGELGVDGLEFLDRHVRFTAHFEQRGRIFHFQFQGNRPDSFEVGSDVVAFHAIAARDSERELAVTVMDADGHAIHLRLHEVLDFVAAEMFANRRVKSAKLVQRGFILCAVAFVAVGFLGAGRMFGGRDLVQREHRHEMSDAGKLRAGRTADALGG